MKRKNQNVWLIIGGATIVIGSNILSFFLGSKKAANNSTQQSRKILELEVEKRTLKQTLRRVSRDLKNSVFQVGKLSRKLEEKEK